MTRPGTETIARRWQHHADRKPDAEAVVFMRAGETPIRWTWALMLERARTLAARLLADGVGRGDVCALVIRHHPDFYPLYAAVELIGAIPAVLAYPNPRLHPDKFRAGLEGMARHSGLDWLLTERALEPVVRPLTIGAHATVRGVLLPFDEGAPRPGGDDMRPLGADEAEPSPVTSPCLLQHSSGTTGLQKAVMLSHAAVLRHVDDYARAIRLTSDDRIVSWLPLYHDMGLIAAFHLALATGTTTIQLDPFEWITAPVLFLDALARERGTLGWLPNFAYNLMATRVHDDELEGLRFDHVRMLVNCSEPVRADSHAAFAARFAPYGLKPEALGASYAMAETTFAVTQTEPGTGARVLNAARDALRAGTYRPAAPGEIVRDVVSSGRPISGCALRVLDEQGAERAEGGVGDLVIRSAAMFDGYRNAPEKTAAVLKDGWYWSGDSGFVLDGEVYVIGRKKDLIIVAGKNLYPEDIEDEIGAVEGILAGRVVAFGVDDADSGTQQVWVAAETEITDDAGLRALRARVVAAGMRIDVTIAETRLVPPRWLIKSSAGKLSRSANRERLLAANEGNAPS
jgi:acyl-CoA synthetase (AMP-forming)/AMP-acid ligase II